MSKEYREGLTKSRRIVVKLGSRVLVQRNGRPSPTRMRNLVRQIAEMHRSGREVVLVSSGAIGAGLEALGLKRRPTNLHDLQMAAAVGQSRLMTYYDQFFAEQKCKIGQVLLTSATIPSYLERRLEAAFDDVVLRSPELREI